MEDKIANINLKELKVKELSIDDYDKLVKYFALRRPETADSNILDLFLWRDESQVSYIMLDEGLIWIAKGKDGRYFSAIPLCKKDNLSEYFQLTKRYFNEILHKKVTMYVVDKEAVDILNLDENEYVLVKDRSAYDYVYDAEKLRNFSGKKYHSKKNHLNFFKREYENRYEFKFLSKENESEILEFLEKWKDTKINASEHEFIDIEADGIKYILDIKEKLDYKIGAVYIDNVLQAFTIGNYYKEEDMVYIPVEKANHEIRGLYQFLCSEFLKQGFPEAGKENREDDMGLESLRKSKESYKPIYMVEKYTIIEK